jgi:hypothetical protein
MLAIGMPHGFEWLFLAFVVGVPMAAFAIIIWWVARKR